MTAGRIPNPCASEIHRIVMHWTAGRHWVSETDRNHYHEIVSGFGNRVKGVFCPADNVAMVDCQYAAHTKNLNAGSIGLSMAAMFDARECPFDPGFYEITPVQLDVFCKMVAEYCLVYEVPITRQTVLTHAEVQPTLGVKQSGKWDIRVLPGMDHVGDPTQVGDQLRLRIQSEIRLNSAQRHMRWVE